MMTLDQASAFLATKGFYLSSISRIAPEMGYMAASRPLKGSIVAGDAGFGQTPQLALDKLLVQHGYKPAAVAAPLPEDLMELLG